MNAAPRRVLVVEDDSSQQLMYKKALRAMDFEAVCVDSGKQAMDALAADRFAIVVLDLQLGSEMSLDLFEEIRDRHPAVSVVIATGHGTFDLARRCIHKDVVDFLAKPIPISDLEVALDRAWSRHLLVHTPVHRLLMPQPKPSPAPALVPGSLTTRDDLNLETLERELILEALRRTDDNRTLAAKMLGISERKLYYRLTQYRVGS